MDGLRALVAEAARRGASDLHVEPGLPVTLRIRGALVQAGPAPSPEATAGLAREALDAASWERLQAQGSADLGLTLDGQRCRVNALRTAAGVGLAVRLLARGDVTLDSLNLHPDFAKLVEPAHGLVIVSGPTGCGKTSTLAALVQEVNLVRAAHIVTIEHPIEYALTPVKAFIRQREVGRDTPSFGQALLDSLREDIDVLMVGEMREQQTMRLTLDACETGHLVLATLHSSTVGEALQRIVSAFPAEQQPSVCAQLADVLQAVVCQRLAWREDLGFRVPECELLLGNTAVKAMVRQGQLFKLAQALETGGRAGMWTLPRYREWLAERTHWNRPGDGR